MQMYVSPANTEGGGMLITKLPSTLASQQRD